jgi:lycopene cyclase domain-containing protein
VRSEYLLLMAACLLVTLPLEFWLRARVYRRPVRLLLALVPAVVVFYAWDAIAIARGHWTYSPDQTTGWLLPFGVPVEELVFFLVVPICGLLTYEAVGTILRRRYPVPEERSGEERARSRHEGPASRRADDHA